MYTLKDLKSHINVKRVNNINVDGITVKEIFHSDVYTYYRQHASNTFELLTTIQPDQLSKSDLKSLL